MANSQVSPISQFLSSMGITREDLNKRSDQMRQFLTASDTSTTSRIPDRDNPTLSSAATHDPKAATLKRTNSRVASSSLQGVSPKTPVKSEPTDVAIPLRHYDSMEMVIERKRRQSKREKRSKRDSERLPATSTSMPITQSKSPKSTPLPSFSLDSFMKSRDDRRVPDTTGDSGSTSSAAPAPITPRQNKYYRDRTSSSSMHSHKRTPVRLQSPTPVHPRAEQVPHSSQPQPSYPYQPVYSQYLPVLFQTTGAGSSTLPVTPNVKRSRSSRTIAKSPFLSSSPPPSSPPSSPSRRVVNMVSSPGPMGPAPEEEEYDRLPYVLPPGPYMPQKPDASYAALIGQAILSSPEHRLTLQEIYDWITIVYPYFKRGETTWMNSIRHVLSTTVCFRKVVRERSVGRSLWAIWDEDLECFKGGGFRKQLCKDVINTTGGKAGYSRFKQTRKRDEVDDLSSDARTVKKARPNVPHPTEILVPSAMHSYIIPAPLGSHLLFPTTRPTPQHQPYYESCFQQPQLAAEVIFPPLPPTAAYNRILAALPTATPVLEETSQTKDPGGSTSSVSLNSQQFADSSASSSVPRLSPHRGSSSPPSSTPPATSELEIDLLGRAKDNLEEDVVVAVETVSRDTEARADDLLNESLLSSVQFWNTPKSLQPGIDLLNFDAPLEEDEEKTLFSKVKKTQKFMKTFPLVPTSPTLERKAAPKPSTEKAAPKTPPPQSSANHSSGYPTTPPRRSNRVRLSPCTPLSQKGLHMSPSSTLMHYKSRLDPPPLPALVCLPDSKQADDDDDEFDPSRTPSRKRVSMIQSGPPVTPKKAGTFGNENESPFRTPNSRTIFDPHDPRALLDEELSRIGYAGGDDSPTGLFGKGRGSLLYDSPGALLENSPGKWARWW